MCKRINIFFPIFLLSYLVLSTLYGFVVRITGLVPPLWCQYLISEGILLLAPIVYILINRINVLKCLPIRKLKPLDALLSLLFGYCLIPCVLVVNYITMLFSTNFMEETQTELMQYPYLIQLILIAVLPPLVEEFIFRGLFYHSYRRNGIVGAALVSGLIFGCVHLNFNQFCYAFLMGVVFALLVEATGSLWSSVITHFAINSYSITVLKLYTLLGGDEYLSQAQDTASTMTTGNMIVAIIVLLFFAVLGLTLAVVIYRGIAIRNGRWDYIQYNLKLGLKAQNGEKFLSIFSIAGFVAAVAVMILVEL